MAASCAKNTLRLSSLKTLLSRSPTVPSSTATKLRGLSPVKPSPSLSPSSSRSQLFTFSRIPSELGGVLSVMPLHSVTASALFTSLLCLSNQSWGCLSEGARPFLLVLAITLYMLSRMHNDQSSNS